MTKEEKELYERVTGVKSPEENKVIVEHHHYYHYSNGRVYHKKNKRIEYALVLGFIVTTILIIVLSLLA